MNLPIEEVVRQRLYPGGIDEQPLAVQDPLHVPWRSMNLLQVQKDTLDEVLGDSAPDSDEGMPPEESFEE